MNDMVNHPAHYTQYKMEVIELTQYCGFCIGNAFKYILRAPFKGNEKEDLEKARWYINRHFENKLPNPKIPFEIRMYFSDVNPIVGKLLSYFEYCWGADFAEAMRLLEERIKNASGKDV